MTTQYLLATIAQALDSNPQSELERDTLLEDIRHLYRIVKNQTPAQVAKVEKHTPTPEVIETPLRSLKVKPLLPSIALEDTEIASTTEAEKDADEIDVYATMTRPLPTVSSINDGHSKEEVSLNKKLSSETKVALNDHAASRSLKSLIDLNKQFVITNELFKGDNSAFAEAIHRIDDCAGIEQAFTYIKNELLPVYHWSSTDQATKLFDKLVRQKFGVS